MEYKFVFSIVMAIYNTKPFLREALNSVINQDISKFDIPLEQIVQVIMVDDGSTDGSEKIVDEYAALHPNFFAVHKKNGGLSSARNAGMKYAEGKYMNFMDSDDKFSENVLWEIYSFFEEHYDETDIVSMPMKFFDAMTGDCWENDKFNNGSRIINLYREFNVTAMFVTCNFFKTEYKERICFDEKLVICEDIKFTSTMMLEKMTLGVVNSCTYFYRQRTVGEESLIQASKNNPNWYFKYFTYSFEWVMDYMIKHKRYIPYYVQYVYAMDIGWRFSDKYESTALAMLGEKEYERYKQVLFNTMRYFDDEIILCENSWPEFKVMMLRKKYKQYPQLLFCSDDIGLCYNDNKPFYWLSDCYTMVDFIDIKGNALTIEGYTMLFGLPDDEPVEVLFKVSEPDFDDQYIKCDINQNRNVNHYRLDEILYRGIAFSGTVTLESNSTKAMISIVCLIQGHKVEKKDIRFGTFSTIGTEYSSEYYIQGEYEVTRWHHYICFEKSNKKKIKAHKNNFFNALKTYGGEAGKKAYYALNTLKFLQSIKHNQIWLISDEHNQAGNNGEALFKYLRKNKPKNINVYFIINTECRDYERVKKIGNVIPYLSHKHKLLFLLADAVISSSADEKFFNPFGGFEGPYRKFIANKKYIYMPSEIISNDLSLQLNKYSKPVRGLTTSSEAEMDSILKLNYNYKENEIWLTGSPRCDLLYDNRQKQITIMPELRQYIMRLINENWYPKNNFAKSDYLRFYNRLINNTKLISVVKEFGYTIRFISHLSMSDTLKYFNENENVVFCGSDISYRDVFAESDMIITDYSTAVFDFAYLKKPLIYAQFDVEHFYSQQELVKSYFDYERDGFGEVTYDLDTTVDMIIEYIKNGCQLKNKYRERIDNFFAFSDKNNCRRVYDRIVQMLEEQ